jgi:hypothetical protein
VKLYLHSPTTPSWRGAQLRKAQGQLYLYLLPLSVIKIMRIRIIQDKNGSTTYKQGPKKSEDTKKKEKQYI